MHSSIIFTHKFLKLFQFFFLHCATISGNKSGLPIFVCLLNDFDILSTYFVDLLQNFIDCFNGSSNEGFLSHFGSDLEKSTIDLINSNSFHLGFGFPNVSQFFLDFLLIIVWDRRSFICKQLLDNGWRWSVNQKTEFSEVVKNLKWFLSSLLHNSYHIIAWMTEHGVISRDWIGRNGIQVQQRNQLSFYLIEVVRNCFQLLKRQK